MPERIKIRCPGCGRETDTPRLEYDPAEAVVVEIQCDECNPGDFESVFYFDAAGNEVSCDPYA